MKIYGKEIIKHDSEKIVAEWLESYDANKTKHKFDFAIASKDIIIAREVDKEIKLININKKLIEIYQKKIKDKLSEIWGE